MIDLHEHIATLPDPEIDERPLAILANKHDIEKARANREDKKQYLDIKIDTETRTKYILTSLMGGNFDKAGDWVTIAGGQKVFQKKVADYSGSLPHGEYNAATHVEVKGISPGNNFQLSRLDRRNNPRKPSQHEKLMDTHLAGDLVLLSLGFWDARLGAVPVVSERHGRKYTYWKKNEVDLTIYLIPWKDWLSILDQIKPHRSIRQKDRKVLEQYTIRKVGNRWTLHESHWFNDFGGQMSLF